MGKEHGRERSELRFLDRCMEDLGTLKAQTRKVVVMAHGSDSFTSMYSEVSKQRDAVASAIGTGLMLSVRYACDSPYLSQTIWEVKAVKHRLSSGRKEAGDLWRNCVKRWQNIQRGKGEDDDGR